MKSVGFVFTCSTYLELIDVHSASKTKVHPCSRQFFQGKDDIFKKYEKIVALGFKNIQVRVHLEICLASLHIFTASHLGIRQKWTVLFICWHLWSQKTAVMRIYYTKDEKLIWIWCVVELYYAHYIRNVAVLPMVNPLVIVLMMQVCLWGVVWQHHAHFLSKYWILWYGTLPWK